MLSLPYPAGPFIDRWVREKATDADRAAFHFPRSKVKDYHYSFSGFKTAVKQQIEKIGKLDDAQTLSVVASAQEAIVDALAFQLETAQKDWGISQVALSIPGRPVSQLMVQSLLEWVPQTMAMRPSSGMPCPMRARASSSWLAS